MFEGAGMLIQLPIIRTQAENRKYYDKNQKSHSKLTN